MKVNKVYKCDCECSAIEIQDDAFEKEIKGDKWLNFCIWRRGSPNNGKWTIRNRLRWIWYVIKDKNLFCDDIILNKTTAVELANDILKWAEDKD